METVPTLPETIDGKDTRRCLFVDALVFCRHQAIRICHVLPMPTAWWRHQMETISALLAICAGNSPVSGEFPAQGPVTRSFDVFFDLCLNKRLSKQSWGWWFETLSHPLWCHCNGRKCFEIYHEVMNRKYINEPDHHRFTQQIVVYATLRHYHGQPMIRYPQW